MIPSPRIKGFTLRDYFDIVWKRVWVVIICVILAAGYAVVTSVGVSTLYRSESAVVLENGKIRPKQTFFKNSMLAIRVTRILNLKESSDTLLSMIKIIPREGNVYEISVTGKDPEKVTNIANAWAKEAIKMDQERSGMSVGEEITSLEKNLSETTKSLVEAEAKLNVYAQEHSEVAEKELQIESLEGQVAQIKKDIQNLSTVYEEDNPKMVFLNSKLQTLDEKLRKEKAGLSAMQGEVVEYRTLKREVGDQKAMYAHLLKGIQEKKLSQKMIVSNIRMVDTAQVPTRPLSMAKKVAVTIVIGFLIGVVICFSSEYMDPTLKKAEEVEFYARLPFLGYIPSIRKLVKTGKELNLFSHLNPDSQVAEAFRNVKVSLIFATPEDKFLKTIAVTSSSPEEGKTFIASNLAISFARAKENTLLIDGDMRKGKLRKYFNAGAEYGLSEILDGECSMDDAVVPTTVPNLSLLCAGTPVHNPTDLLSSERFGFLIEELKSKFQRIVIDIPEILGHADVLLWGHKCDGVVNVIGAGFTPLKDIRSAKEKLEGKVGITGAVLNNVAVEKDMYYYYHYYQGFIEEKIKGKKAKKEEKGK
ncbi:MAG: polysaccharide biosynthesis tyrosine autokinase [Candidatus Omnitrophota bacterium]